MKYVEGNPQNSSANPCGQKAAFDTVDASMQTITSIRVYKGAVPTEAEMDAGFDYSSRDAADLLCTIDMTLATKENNRYTVLPPNPTAVGTGDATWIVIESGVVGYEGCWIVTDKVSIELGDGFLWLDTLTCTTGQPVVLRSFAWGIARNYSVDYYSL